MNNFGYYGKTKHRGDFVRYNLPRVFVSVWDDWLQQLLLQGEDAHDTTWSERYAAGAGHWFALSSGIAGDQAWGGIMIPSVDKVGRRFPFCLAAALPPGVPASQAPGQLHSTYRALDDLTTDINAPDFDFDQVQVRLAELADATQSRSPAPVDQSSPADGVVEPGEGRVQVRIEGPSTLDSLDGATALLDAVLVETVFQYSLWITRDTSAGGAGTFLTSGLPMERAGVALFDADWDCSRCRRLTITARENAGVLADTETLVAGAEDPPEVPPTAQQDAPPAAPVDESSLPEQSATVESSAEQGSEIATLSTGDWTEFATSLSDEEPPEIPVPLPTIEPLDIEEDVNEPAPWDS